MADYAYCTIDDLNSRYGSLQVLQASDREGDGVVNQDTVSDACADATEEIDSYLGERYTLPLSPISGMVKNWATAIAWFKLQLSPRSEFRDAYEDAIADLGRARDGKQVLQLNGVAAAGVPVDGDAVSIAGAPRMFDASSLRHF